MMSPNAKSGDTQNTYTQEQQIIDDYLKQINPNFSAENLIVHIGLTQKKHFLFDVLYKGILVDKHKITLHQHTDTTMLITGTTLFSNDIVVEPTLTLEQAIEKLKLQNNEITDESILSNKLVIFKYLGGEPLLSYKIEVSLATIKSYQYYISATNGEIININPLTRSATPKIGTASLHNWGTQNIFTSFEGTNKYILYDHEAKIRTCQLYNNTIHDIIDNNNIWTLNEFPETNTYSLNAFLVCHWSARKAHDFFHTTFGRNGYSGNNDAINIWPNFVDNQGGANANWDPTNNAILIGAGNNNLNNYSHHFGVTDIVAHEYGHAVADHLDKNLAYWGESGAIDEGLADIWAACIENYIGGQTFYEIWNIGDHRGNPDRCLHDPKSKNHPNTYKKTYWVNATDITENNDCGGVHTNCNVLSYWFYLLTMGGTGTNDKGNEYIVNGLGFTTSQQIVYETITGHLKENSTFEEFRNSTIEATISMYDEYSNEHIQVMNAWYAVGIGEEYKIKIIGKSNVCDGGVYSMNFWDPATSITWSVDNFTDALNQQRPKLNIATGQYTGTITVERALTGLANITGTYYYYNGPVTLTATISSNNMTYTIEKELFVNTPLPDIKYTTRQVSNVSMNKIYKFYVDNVASTHLNWRIEANGNIHTATGQNYIEISLPIVRQYDVVVSVRDDGGCSESNYKTRTLKGTSIVAPILAHENPVSTNSVFYLKKTTDELDEGVVFNIEIWNKYSLVRSERYDDAPEFMVSTDGLIPGIYFMRIYRNGELLDTQKLIIK